ncbi:hypothetical protein ACFOU2_24545 [Bacillus songklensis]|uniref:Zinc-ribbon domain-containing protein n=1 Tax=Bacillus songklensis TaxID=1069116 RepID=A0ABV8B827_9BACI
MMVCSKCGAPAEEKSYCRVCGYGIQKSGNEDEARASLKLQAEGKQTLTKEVIWTSLFVFLGTVMAALGCAVFLTK